MRALVLHRVVQQKFLRFRDDDCSCRKQNGLWLSCVNIGCLSQIHFRWPHATELFVFSLSSRFPSSPNFSRAFSVFPPTFSTPFPPPSRPNPDNPGHPVGPSSYFSSRPMRRYDSTMRAIKSFAQATASPRSWRTSNPAARAEYSSVQPGSASTRGGHACICR